MVSNVKYKNLNKFSTTFPPVGLMIVEGWSWWEWRNRIVAQNYYEIRTQFATSFLFRAIGRRFANQVVVILTSNDIPGYLHLLCRIGAVESGIIISGCRYQEPECWNVSHCQLKNWQRCISDVFIYIRMKDHCTLSYVKLQMKVGIWNMRNLHNACQFLLKHITVMISNSNKCKWSP